MPASHLSTDSCSYGRRPRRHSSCTDTTEAFVDVPGGETHLARTTFVASLHGHPSSVRGTLPPDAQRQRFFLFQSNDVASGDRTCVATRSLSDSSHGSSGIEHSTARTLQGRHVAFQGDSETAAANAAKVVARAGGKEQFMKTMRDLYAGV